MRFSTEARRFLSVLYVSFFQKKKEKTHQNHGEQDWTEWLGQHADVRNIQAAIFKLISAD